MPSLKESLTPSHWFENGVFAEKRVIYLENANSPGETVTTMNEVADTMASKFIKGISLLEAINEDPITILMNTPGGCQYSGFAIFDRIKESPCHITIRGYGSIMSMGAVIMQAADERQVTPNSWVMVHEGYDDLIGLGAQSLANWAVSLQSLNKRMYEIFLEPMKKKNPKLTIGRLENMLKDDIIYPAEKAVEVGLVDKIYTGE